VLASQVFLKCTGQELKTTCTKLKQETSKLVYQAVKKQVRKD